MNESMTNTILIVDDQRNNREIMKAILARPEYSFIEAEDGREAIKILCENKADLMILDLVMPKANGFEVLEAVKVDPKIRKIPVIVLSTLDDSGSIEKALTMGANDYLHKNISDEDRKFTIPLKVKNLLELKNTQDLLEQNLKAVERLSIIDDVSLLFNYRYFKERLYEEFSRGLRYKRPMSLMILDLDHLKEINDRFGHPRGTDVIARVGQIILQDSRTADIPVRYGGDEFCIIAPEIDLLQALYPAERLRIAIEKLGHELDLKLTASVGIAAIEEGETFASIEELMQAADDSCYEAKRNGRNCVYCYYRGKILPAESFHEV